MTNNSPDYFDEAPGGLSFMARMKAGVSTAIGATAALGIIFAMGVWFYRLGDRDARNVPIIRAEASAAKRIPDDPGGAKTPHQGITSYDAADGASVSAGAAVIAPEPAVPKREDIAMGELEVPEEKADSEAITEDPLKAEIERAVDEVAPKEAVAAPKRPVTDDKTGAEAGSPEDASATTEAESGAEATDEKVAALDTEVNEEAATEETATIADEEIRFPDSTEFAPDASPTAPRRPTNLVARNEAAAKTAETAETDLITKAATSAFQIQLAADPDRGAVVKLWSRISKANADVLRGRALAVQTTVSGGTTFYRLRVGPFASRAEAVSVCQALKARNQDCIVARNS